MFATPNESSGQFQTSLPSVPDVDIGTVITATTSANTKGVWVNLISALSYDCYELNIAINATQTSGGGVNDGVVVDIGVGTAIGSEVVLIPDLLASRLKVNAAGQSCPMFLQLPIFIPKGNIISARLQSTSTSRTAKVAVWCSTGASAPRDYQYVGCDALGVVTSATTSGFSHTPGNTGTFSSWTQIPTATTTSRAYKGILLVCDGEEATASALLYYHTEIGYNTRAPLLGQFWSHASASEVRFSSQNAYPQPFAIPSGTQLEIRATSSGTAEVMEYALYCFY